LAVFHIDVYRTLYQSLRKKLKNVGWEGLVDLTWNDPLGLLFVCVFFCFFLTRVSLCVIGLVILCFCALFGCCLGYSTCAVNCSERPVPKMACYMSNETLNSTHTLTSTVVELTSVNLIYVQSCIMSTFVLKQMWTNERTVYIPTFINTHHHTRPSWE